MRTKIAPSAISTRPALLVGIGATGNYGAGYAEVFDALYPELAEAHGVALFPSFFAGLEAAGDRQTVLRTYFQPDATHPNAAGVGLIVAAMGPAVLDLLGQVR